MDITHSLDLFRDKLNLTCRLKEYRTAKNLSQTELSLLSGVPLRTIKAYEQGSVDIAKAQAETLYALSQTLNCSIEDLIK
jgi:transcriptional regulator with XRE-family HTH domain